MVAEQYKDTWYLKQVYRSQIASFFINPDVSFGEE
jgi:hypothetical protein